MKCKYPLVVLGFILASFSSLAQDRYTTISARVIDRETAEPLAFASVGLENTSLGTITNAEGEFDFHIPVTQVNSRLTIRMLGYVTYVAPVREVPRGQMVLIEMARSVTVLDEVVIVDSLTGGDILRIALSRINANYPANPYSMEGFYRDVKKVDDEYISVLEAALKIYDKDYSEPRNQLKLRERVGLIEVRKSLNYEFAYNRYFDKYNLLEELLLENNIKYRTFTAEPVFYQRLERDTLVQTNEQAFYRLTLRGDMDYFLEVIIDVETYGIHKLVYHYGDYKNSLQSISRSGQRTEQMVRQEKVIEFAPYRDKLFLKYLSVRSTFNWLNRSGQKQATTELQQELLINKVVVDNPQWVRSSEKMRGYGLQYQDEPYNEEFWDNYNVIKDTPLDVEIVRDLEKYGDLEVQFRENRP